MWASEPLQIGLADHGVAFKVVHTVLAIVSVSLALWADREANVAPRPEPVSADPGSGSAVLALALAGLVGFGACSGSPVCSTGPQMSRSAVDPLASVDDDRDLLDGDAVDLAGEGPGLDEPRGGLDRTVERRRRRG